MLPSLETILSLLDLRPHPTCGLTRETFVSATRLPAEVLPQGYSGPRHLGGFLYFLITPEHGVRLHRIRSEQMYHHYLGQPLDVLLLCADGSSQRHTLGPDLDVGMRPQLLIPGNAFHAARLARPEGYALLGTSVWLRAEPDDVQMGDAAAEAPLSDGQRRALGAFRASGAGWSRS